MAHPGRNASAASILNPSRTFFVTTKTAMGKQLLQSERNAGLFIEALPSLVAEHKFKLHDFVVMPDHVHLLIDVAGEMTIEKAMQFVKGRNHQSLDAHRAYIGENPAKAGLARSAEEYPFSFSVFGAQEKRS